MQGNCTLTGAVSLSQQTLSGSGGPNRAGFSMAEGEHASGNTRETATRRHRATTGLVQLYRSHRAFHRSGWTRRKDLITALTDQQFPKLRIAVPQIPHSLDSLRNMERPHGRPRLQASSKRVLQNCKQHPIDGPFCPGDIEPNDPPERFLRLLF